MARADVAAMSLLDKFGVDTFPIDPMWLAGQLDVAVVPQKMAPEVSGMLLRGDGHQVIGVNESHHRHRRRFTVAHELGHLQLHRGRPLILDTDMRVNFRDSVSSMATDREEIEANRFAAALLAPEAMVRACVAETVFATAEELVDALASRFHISAQAMTYRLMSVGIISGPGS
ncbi:ImmA/IrrE family metallo-endopeptidase [Streptacidiphilus sp. N1-3]|jgi:Zn-dependent peptidase ImmA (M78 family)|uniref:ImmA/IrrE family metallo-endopeptidase n=1 Tax=Streptacidiphilus alkalitolerans TaxID=3342712 RepID=A0ABV6X5G0_9ACTN